MYSDPYNFLRYLAETLAYLKITFWNIITKAITFVVLKFLNNDFCIKKVRVLEFRNMCGSP